MVYGASDKAGKAYDRNRVVYVWCGEASDNADKAFDWAGGASGMTGGAYDTNCGEYDGR